MNNQPVHAYPLLTVKHAQGWQCQARAVAVLAKMVAKSRQLCPAANPEAKQVPVHQRHLRLQCNHGR